MKQKIQGTRKGQDQYLTKELWKECQQKQKSTSKGTIFDNNLQDSVNQVLHKKKIENSNISTKSSRKHIKIQFFHVNNNNKTFSSTIDYKVHT